MDNLEIKKSLTVKFAQNNVGKPVSVNNGRIGKLVGYQDSQEFPLLVKTEDGILYCNDKSVNLVEL